jgi:hypothetical protein
MERRIWMAKERKKLDEVMAAVAAVAYTWDK